MAITVPVAKQNVAPTAVPGARVNVGVPLAAFGPNIGAINDAAQKLFAEEKQKADLTAFHEADLKASMVRARLETDNRKNLKGKDAAGAADSADLAFKDSLAEIAKGLSNDTQRQMFERSSGGHRASLYSSLEHYAGDEIAKYSVGVEESYTNQTKVDAATAASKIRIGDPAGTEVAMQEISTQMEKQRASVVALAKLRGMDDRQALDLVKHHKSDTHRAVISVLLKNDSDVEASRYAEMYKGEIIGEKDINEVAGALAEGSSRGEARRAHDELVTKFPGDLTKQLEAAKEIKNTKTYDRLVEKLKDTHHVERVQQKEREDADYIKYASMAEKAGTVDAIPADVWYKMAPSERTTIEQRLKHLKAGTEPEMDYVKYTNFMVMPQTEKAKLTEARLMREFRPYLDDQHYDDVLRRVQGIKDAQTKDDKAYLTNMQSNSDIMESAFEKYLNKPKNKWSDNEKISYAMYSDAAAKAVNEYEAANKDKASVAEKQVLVNKLIADQVTVGKGFWGKGKGVPLAIVREDDKVSVDLDKIPPEAKKNIVNIMRSEGLVSQKATDADILASRRDEIERYYGRARTGVSRESAMLAFRGWKPKK